MKGRYNNLTVIPENMLSNQQKQIYELCCQGFSNKDISRILNLKQKTVATQLSRIRKKAAGLDFTYKIEPGAEHACCQVKQNSPASELKKKIRDDPGFFRLMYLKYATRFLEIHG